MPLDKSRPYCALNHIELEKGFMERQRCKEKECPYFTYIQKVYKYDSKGS